VPIRRARVTELERLRDIERDAGRAFAEIGMGEIAADEPPSVSELREFAEAGRAWVATDTDDVPVAYLLSALVDEAAHIEQVSVLAPSRGRAIGAALIDHLSAIAARDGRRWVTLTTFRDVPWNAPYYERLGFTTIGSGEYGPELAALVEVEASRIPGELPRVAMRRLAEVVNASSSTRPARSGSAAGYPRLVSQGPVTLRGSAATSSGVPCETTRPPAGPPPGPMSMT
jgi:GNAT superfamily N-acetyltransferase